MRYSIIVARTRAEQNMTPRELAEKAGVSTQTVHDIENGKNKDIYIATLCKVASALGLSVRVEFLKGDVYEPDN